MARKTISIIEGGSHPENLDDVRRAIESLRLDQLAENKSFDYEPFHTELDILRKSIEKEERAAEVSVLESDKYKELEAENGRIRVHLKETQEELAKASAAVTSAQSIADKSSEEAIQLRGELAQRTAQVSRYEAEATAAEVAIVELKSQYQMDMAQHETEIASLRSIAIAADQNSVLLGETSRLKNEISALKSTLSEVRAASTRCQEEQAAIILELQSELSSTCAALQVSRDEFVEAEVVHKERAVAFDQTLRDRTGALESELNKLRGHNGTLMTSLQTTQSKLALLRQELTSISAKARADLSEMSRGLEQMVQSAITKHVRDADLEMKKLLDKYRTEMSERKRLHNLVQELKGNIRVFLRCRPPTAKELELYGGDCSCITFPEPQKVSVYNMEKAREKTWEFDEVFGFNASQAEVFREVSSLIVSTMDGYNVCIFAYGQTGSGKTHTMSGPPSSKGVNTRSLAELFARSAARSADISDTFSVNVLEVYNEDVFDLLVDGANRPKLEIRHGERGTFVQGLTNIEVDSLENVMDLLSVADRNRSQASTNLNEHSSRSHMIVTVSVTSENILTGVITRGKLNLVDLAGSERIDKSGAMGQALREAQNINKSLSALGDVISARVAKQAHIPFRNSTLTFLLQDSLSQDSKTLMIVCASPVMSNVEETFCSLNFASRSDT